MREINKRSAAELENVLDYFRLLGVHDPENNKYVHISVLRYTAEQYRELVLNLPEELLSPEERLSSLERQRHKLSTVSHHDVIPIPPKNTKRYEELVHLASMDNGVVFSNLMENLPNATENVKKNV